MLVFLVVHSGMRELTFLAKNDAEHYLPELELFHRQHGNCSFFLIKMARVKPRRQYTEVLRQKSGLYTPANASWLGQAEINCSSIIT